MMIRIPSELHIPTKMMISSAFFITPITWWDFVFLSLEKQKNIISFQIKKGAWWPLLFKWIGKEAKSKEDNHPIMSLKNSEKKDSGYKRARRPKRKHINGEKKKSQPTTKLAGVGGGSFQSEIKHTATTGSINSSGISRREKKRYQETTTTITRVRSLASRPVRENLGVVR
jgi:hypothetical protein